jgi:hypothetical protein
MKKLILATLSLAFANSAFAFLPVSAITTLSLPVYGIYITADATCTSGFVATIPLSTTAKAVNFASNAAIGAGSLPSTIGCVVIVAGNNLTTAWAAGTYTDSSKGGGGDSHSDNIAACTAGGATTDQHICRGNTVSWPSQITTDAAAVGLTLSQTTCAGTSSDVIPLVLSTNSVCTGQSAADASVTACAGGNNNGFSLPTSTADPSNGIKLTAPSAAGDVKFVVNPSNTVGATSASSCGNISAPLFSFAAY